MRPAIRPLLRVFTPRPHLAALPRHPAARPHRRTLLTLPEFSLNGKTCLVTGAARGLGREFLTAFLLSGAKAGICADVNLKGAEHSVEVIRTEVAQALGLPEDSSELPALYPLEVDVTDERSVMEMMRKIELDLKSEGEKEGKVPGVDVLVTAAGICQNYEAVDYPAREFQRVLDVNLTGTFLCAREVARSMIERKVEGSMVFVSSMSARIVNRPQPQAAYNASKAGVSHLARSLAAEWAEYGIRVNSLAPGYQMTELLEQVLAREGEGLKNGWEALTPMKRLGNPRELRAKAVFLASDASSFMTGQDLVVDGGYEIW